MDYLALIKRFEIAIDGPMFGVGSSIEAWEIYVQFGQKSPFIRPQNGKKLFLGYTYGEWFFVFSDYFERRISGE